MKEYLDLISDVLSNGKTRKDRTGTGTISVFGRDMRFDLQKGFPLVTTKKVNFSSIVSELLWFLSGSTNIKPLQDSGCNIWNEWATPEGEVGDMYGKQWRNWGGLGIDQISDVVRKIKVIPESRRHIVSAWNAEYLPMESMTPQDNVKIGRMALAPCHMIFQFYVSEGKLSCKIAQRSTDVFLGLPYNIASYAILTHLIAKMTGLEVGELIWSGGEVHIYLDHLDAVGTQMSRTPRDLPTLYIGKEVADYEDISQVTREDINIINYLHDSHIKAKISI